jgi:hypothetical protein
MSVINQEWIKNLVLGNLGKRIQVLKQLVKIASQKKIYLASALKLYKQRKQSGRNYVIPAFNLRGLVFELASAIFQAAKEKGLTSFVFEIARSELEYTAQHPVSYAGLVLAAAIETGWQGPIYLQADHVQVNPARYQHSLEKEIHIVRKLIKEFLKAGFCSIDIDCSPVNQEDQKSPQSILSENKELSAKLLKFIKLVGQGKKVAVGVEVGEIGTHNTTPEELDWFLTNVKKKVGGWQNLTKVAVQTGTKHGGKVNKKGELEKMPVDLTSLTNLNKLALRFGLYGVVQHGASTLPIQVLGKLPKTGTLEVHLATAWQNLIFDNPRFPAKLKDKIYAWIEQKYASKRQPGMSNEQFFYETRKYAWGQFRKDFLNLLPDFKEVVTEEMKKRAEEIFEALGL